MHVIFLLIINQIALNYMHTRAVGVAVGLLMVFKILTQDNLGNIDSNISSFKIRACERCAMACASDPEP